MYVTCQPCAALASHVEKPRKAALGRSSCWRQILKSDFFKVRSVELRSAHVIVVAGSIALGFISEDKPTSRY
jgi:hypothetical protein